MAAPIVQRVTRWYCPNCGKRDVTREAGPHTRFHICPKLRGLSAPLLPEGVAAKVEVREREDYVGRDHVQVDESGRPVMSVVTTRDDGQDAILFMPSATADGRAH